MELTLLWFKVQVVLSEFVKNAMDAFLMEGYVFFCGDKHVVHVYREPSFLDLCKDGIYHCLKGGW